MSTAVTGMGGIASSAHEYSDHGTVFKPTEVPSAFGPNTLENAPNRLEYPDGSKFPTTEDRSMSGVG
jgi:hypothetical protein